MKEMIVVLSVFGFAIFAVYGIFLFILNRLSKKNSIRIIGKDLFLQFITGVSAAVLLPAMAIIWAVDYYFENSPTILLIIISLIIMISVLICIFTLLMKKAWTTVPQNHEYIVEKFGKYIGEKLLPGSYLLFPYFGFVVVNSDVFMGEQLMPLYLNDKKDSEFGKGDVEFRDGSTDVDAFLYFKAVDSYKVAYGAADTILSLAEEADNTLRNYLGNYRIDDASILRLDFNIWKIACGVRLVLQKQTAAPDPNQSPAPPNPNVPPPSIPPADDLIGFKVVSDKDVTESDYQQSPFYLAIKEWGWLATRFTVSNLTLPESIKKQRERILIAEKDLEVAEIEGKTAVKKKGITITNASATAEAEKLLGTGVGQKIKNLAKEANVSEKEALQYLILQQKWAAVATPGVNVMLNEGGDNTLKMGAAFGKGFGFGNKQPGNNSTAGQGGQTK